MQNELYAQLVVAQVIGGLFVGGAWYGCLRHALWRGTSLHAVSMGL
jgi:hypothetical protein